METIVLTLNAVRSGTVCGYLGGLTVERYLFRGRDVPGGAKVALLTPDGRTLAAATVANGEDGPAAEVSTDTQEVADLLRWQPVGAEAEVYVTLGDSDNLLAIVPAKLRKNWLDDEATHPPAPANRYPTKAELGAWLKAAQETEQGAKEAALKADAAAQNAKGSATDAREAMEGAQRAETEAGDAARDAKAGADKAAAAQGAAETARDDAQASALGAASSASAATQAKAGAESAKAGAVAAQGKAEQAATAAEGIKSELSEALAEAAAVEGRVGKLETAQGVYKDPVTGDILHYTPLEKGDGTLKVISNMGLAKKIMPMEAADDTPLKCASDGEFVFLIGSTNYWSKTDIWVYDKDLNRRLALYNRFGAGGGMFSDNKVDLSCYMFVIGTRFYSVRKDGGSAKFSVSTWELDTPDAPAFKTVTDESIKGFINHWFYNELSGHILSVHLRDDNQRMVLLAWDTDLNPVLGEDGAQLEIDVTEAAHSAHLANFNKTNTYITNSAIGHKRVYGRTYVYTSQEATTERAIADCALLVCNADDTLSIVREAVPQEDPDNAGKLLMERDAEGNMVWDDEAANQILRPVTVEGREIRYNTKVEAERNYPANARRSCPLFQMGTLTGNFKSKVWFATDGIDAWMLLSDGRWVPSEMLTYQNGGTIVPLYWARRTGVADAIVTTQYGTNVPLFSLGFEGWDYGEQAPFGLIAYAPETANNALTKNVAVKVGKTRTTIEGPRYLPIDTRKTPMQNASPLGAFYGIFGSPCWYATYKSFVGGILV